MYDIHVQYPGESHAITTATTVTNTAAFRHLGAWKMVPENVTEKPHFFITQLSTNNQLKEDEDGVSVNQMVSKVSSGS